MPDKMTRLHKFWVKLSHWEFWPFDLFYFPVKVYFTWLAIKNRSFFFFTASNPSIEFGGMLGERKSEIYKLIPAEYLPEMELCLAGDMEKALATASRIGYPLIAKPNIGERGKLVEKIKDQEALKAYVEKCPADFLVQELIEYPVELGVFYVRKPGEPTGMVTSIVQKDFLHVIGDGASNVEELLGKSARANLQLDFDHPRFSEMMRLIPKRGEKLTVESIGNHCRGTTFLNKNKEIDSKLNGAIDQLSQRIDGFYYGRFDLRCASFDDLRELRNFKIIELNGAGAEPGHIYQPGSSLLQGYKDILWHFAKLSEISAENRRKGVPFWTYKMGMRKLQEIKAYDQRLNKA